MRLLATAFVMLAAFGLPLVPSAEAKPKRSEASVPAAQQEPGTLLSYDRIALPRNYRAKAWRILYVTRNYRMAPILSTGLVVLPDKAARIPMERTFVAWAHPTTGIARHCAPSSRSAA